MIKFSLFFNTQPFLHHSCNVLSLEYTYIILSLFLISFFFADFGLSLIFAVLKKEKKIVAHWIETVLNIRIEYYKKRLLQLHDNKQKEQLRPHHHHYNDDDDDRSKRSEQRPSLLFIF